MRAPVFKPTPQKREQPEPEAMLKTEYANQSDIPENQRGAYVQKGDKWVLDELDSAHPLVVNSRTLKTEKQQAETAKANAERERDDAKDALSKANVLQPGQRAVAKADADLLEKVKAAGVTTPEAFVTLKTEHGQFKTEAQTAQRRTRFADVGKKLKWNEDTADVLDVVPNLPDIEDRDVQVNGKAEKVPHAKLVTKNASGQEEVSYRPFGEWFAETHPALHRSVQAQPSGGTRVPGSSGAASPANQTPLSDKTMEGWGPKKAAA